MHTKDWIHAYVCKHSHVYMYMYIYIYGKTEEWRHACKSLYIADTTCHSFSSMSGRHAKTSCRPRTHTHRPRRGAKPNANLQRVSHFYTGRPGAWRLREAFKAPRAEPCQTKSAGFQVSRDHWQRLRRAPPSLAFVAPGVPLKFRPATPLLTTLG